MSNSLYHKAICEEMEKLANIPNSIFLGQQCFPENFYGTLEHVSYKQRIEMPVAEELQLGMSIGMAMSGYLPISIYQRMDFLPRACDQLVNHLDLISILSRNKFNPKIIIRTTIGSHFPLDVGLQHNKNLIEGFQLLLPNTVISEVKTPEEVHFAYTEAIEYEGSTIIVEHQDLYNE